MPRPSAITPEVAAAIAAERAPGMTVSALHRRLAERGVRIARGTLDRYLRTDASEPTGPAHPTPAGGVAALEREAAAALAGDELEPLRRTRAAVQRGIDSWLTKVGRDARAVRALALLTRVAADLTRSIVELTPRPEGDRYRPLEGEAMARLLDRCESNARADAGALERLATFERLLADGRLVSTEGE